MTFRIAIGGLSAQGLTGRYHAVLCAMAFGALGLP